MILIWDNLAGHLSTSIVTWLFAHGVMPLYTPLSGSWLNMAESVQRIICGRALNGQHPQTVAQVITWLEDTVAGLERQPDSVRMGRQTQGAPSPCQTTSSPALNAATTPQLIAA